MHHRLLLVAAAALVVQAAVSQTNSVAGLDGNLYEIGSPTVWGRRGAPKPNGEMAFSPSNTMCNSGSVTIPWFAQMAQNHPKFGFMLVRVTGDRMQQINLRDSSYCKHAFLSLNSNSGPCLPCAQPNVSAQQMWVGCGDVYSASNNGSRNNLGPPDEIDPWLGTWNNVGSYFDRGDPDVGSPANNDGVQSAISTAGDTVKNRITVPEPELIVPASTFFYQVHLLHEGERIGARANNLRNRGVTVTSTTTTAGWSMANSGVSQSGSILTRWTGATFNLGTNGTTNGSGIGSGDGQVGVAVKVTGPTNGLYHYEYAIHNIDASRGNAAFRLPVCSTARVLNVGFRDTDQNALNQWTHTFGGGELAFTAPGTNPQNWNSIFNFWFDSDAAPVAGNLTLDAARIGPGALQFTVAAQVPGYVPNIHLGAGCGTPALDLVPNGIATDNAAFALNLTTQPFTPVILFGTPNALTTPAGACNVYLDTGATLETFGLTLTDVTGLASFALPVPVGLVGAMAFQGVAIVPGVGAFLGDYNLSNGVYVRAGQTGCQ